MGIRASDCQQKVFIPESIVGVDKPEVVVRIVNQGSSIILAVYFCPPRLGRLGTGQVDVMHIAEVESFVSPKNSGQFAAHFVVIKMSGEIFPVVDLFEKRRDFDCWHLWLLCYG
ncbi:hypothetical protein EMIT0P2_50124 [Pseudomonas sp. IT-P2]